MRYSTCITKKTKLNKNEPTEVIYTVVNSKVMNIVRVQKVQETDTTPAKRYYNINVAVAMLY